MRIAGLLCALSLACGGCLGPVAGLYPPPPSQPQHDIYVCGNGWHTGIILNLHDLTPRGQTDLKRFAAYPWVEIGWGDDGFYRAKNENACLAIGAMFFSHASVLHVVGIWPDPKTFYQNFNVSVDHLRISETGFRRMEKRILDSFRLDEKAHPMELQEGLYGFSRFFVATGHYWLGHTCNDWTAEALRETGFPITPAYAQTAGNVMFQLSCGPYPAEKL